MEMILFVGAQGSGKSTFYRQRFFNSHLRVSLDMLKTRHRERLIVKACLDSKQRFVVDNTNPTAADRSKYIALAKSHGFRIIAYFFVATIDELLQRNALREGKERIPELGVRGTFKKLEPIALEEGFDELFQVSVLRDLTFDVRSVQHEI